MNPEPTNISSVDGGGLFGSYQPAPGCFDEMLGGDADVRPQWNPLVHSLDQLGREELSARWENARRIIREHGVSYNVYGDAEGLYRQWELDMLPLVVAPEEWARLEAALRQRSALLNAILVDLCAGSQRLLRDGFLPPPLVYANPGFLRACHGIKAPENIHLAFFGADLGRSPDGQWWILSDRTQAPSGAGYALENRIVISRVLPDEFRACDVRRLASHFATARETLRRLSRTHRDNPNIVLLTSGPHNETYFEHAYLARYLGFTLVEGEDLTVRDRHVFLKTLEGLQPVDVIFRRLDDAFCDPLELRGDSFLGVPGLVEATRAGHVVLANALGSGLLESPAFLPFLPNLCKHLLGEELLLPCAATWWCGQPKEFDHVLKNLDSLVIKYAFASSNRPVYFCRDLSQAQKVELVEKMRARPWEYVGQEPIELSRAPVWGPSGPEARPVVLRTFSVARDSATDYSVMPGGLTRVSVDGHPVISMQKGGGSKDTWILGGEPGPRVTLLSPTGQPSHPHRNTAELPSRVADNLFWLGRYSERLENTVRIVRCVIARLADEASAEGSATLAATARLLVAIDRFPERFSSPFGLADFQKETLRHIYNEEQPGSVRELIKRLRFIVWTVRDRISLDTWQILNRLQLDSKSRPGRLPVAHALANLNNLVLDLAAFSGMEMENMTRGHGWRFMEVGRRLERGLNVSSLLLKTLRLPDDHEQLMEPLLEIGDSVISFRRRYYSRGHLAGVLDLLGSDAANPRSLSFQVRSLSDHCEHLPGGTLAHKQATEIRGLISKMRSASDVEGVADIASLWTGGLEQIRKQMQSLSDDITQTYFSHTLPRFDS